MSSAFLDRLDAMQAWVRRRRWLIRLASAAILIPLVWPFVSTRWNAQPAQSLAATLRTASSCDLGVTPPPAEVDNTAAVAKALLALPPAPALPVPSSPPKGHAWIPWSEWRRLQAGEPSQPGGRTQPYAFFDATEALTGEWMPERYHLRAVIAYLELPATRTALDSLAKEAGRPHCLTGASVPSGNPLAVLREAVKALTARARYQLAEHHDFQAAVRDIETVLHLSEEMIDDGQLIRFLVAISCRSLALDEIRYWPEEFSLTSAQLDRLVTLLDQHTLDGRAQWKQAMRGEMRGSLLLLDTLFARTADGNGFLILTHSRSDEPPPRLLGALNLMSPLFEDYKTAEKLLVLTDERISRLSELPTKQLMRLATPSSGRRYRPVLGPYWYSWGLPAGSLEESVLQSLVWALRGQEDGDLSATTIALGRHRLDQGRYPERLSLLVPKYLPQMPMDLFAEQPLRYRLKETGGYLLYSVADDGQDDGGQLLGTSDDSWDLVATHERGEPVSEWVLVSEEDSGGRGDGNGAD